MEVSEDFNCTACVDFCDSNKCIDDANCVICVRIVRTSHGAADHGKKPLENNQSEACSVSHPLKTILSSSIAEKAAPAARDENGNGNDDNDNDDEFTLLPKNVVFSHFNEDLLYAKGQNHQRNCKSNGHGNGNGKILASSSSSSSSSAQSSYESKSVLLVGCGSIKRYTVLLSLRNLPGIRHLACLSREKPWANSCFDGWIQADHEDVSQRETTIQRVDTYVQANNLNKFDAILTYDDYCCMVTSSLTNHYQLPGIPLATSQIIQNKFEFRNLCRRLGINHPAYFLVHSADRKKLAMLNHELIHEKVIENGCAFPLILKFPFGAGKNFVRKCSNVEEFRRLLNESIEVSPDMGLLVESFFEGHDIDCEVLIQDNKVKFIITSDNLPPLEPNFYEQGGVTPSVILSKEEKETIEKLVCEWVSELDLQNACLHFEARCRPSLIYKRDSQQASSISDIEFLESSAFVIPIEINIRMGGAETWSMVNAACDIDLMQQAVKIGLGVKLNEKELEAKLKSYRTCISKDLHPAKHVTIESIGVNMRKLKESCEFAEVSIFRSVGDSLTPNDYIGWMTIATNMTLQSHKEPSDIKKLAAIIEQNLSCIKIKFKPTLTQS